MNLYEELKPFEKPDLIVVEHDLSEDQATQKKIVFSTEDRFVDYSLETQQRQGGIVVPIFRSSSIFANRPTKVLDYDVTALGNGLWKLTTFVGTMSLNENDTSYTKENVRKRDRYFLYREQVGGFILIENRAVITETKETISNLLNREDIRNVLHEFEEVIFPKINMSEGRIDEEIVRANLDKIDLYHYVAHVVLNSITRKNYNLISQALSRFNNYDVYTKMVLFKRSVWVDGDGYIHKTIGEIQLGSIPSELFRTRQDKKLLNTFLKTKQEKGTIVLIHLTSQLFPSEFERFKDLWK